MDAFNYKYMDELFLENYKAMDQMTICEDRELKVEIVENATVLPYRIVDGEKRAGVVNGNGEYIELSGFDAISPVDQWGGSYEPEEKPAMIDEEVVYFGRFWKHWGHFLMDMVSRLWYVMDIDESSRIVYDSQVEIEGVYLEFLHLLGIKTDQLIRVDKPTRFRKVIVPECSHKPGISCNQKYKEIFDRVAENALMHFEKPDLYKGRKIYFTRRQLNLRVPLEIGENEIEELFRKNNYLIVAPEKHSLSEQIAMLRQAETIACIAGTLPHNMMFAKDGTKLVIIRKTNKPNYRQVDVNAIRSLDVTNVDAHISLKAVGPAGPFIVDYNQNVMNYFRDNHMVCDSIGIKQHLRRLKKLIWYIPVYILRNRNAKREVPLYDGKGFSTTETAKKELFRFYIKRL